MMFFFHRMLAGFGGWIVRAFCVGCLAAAFLSAGEAMAQEAAACASASVQRGYPLGDLCVARTGDDFGVTHHELCEAFRGTRQTVYAEGVEVPDSALPGAAQRFIAQAAQTRNTHSFCGEMIMPMQNAVRAWALSDPDYHTHLTNHFSDDNFDNCLDSSAAQLAPGTSGLSSPIGVCNFDSATGAMRKGRDRFDCLMTGYVPQIEWTSPEWCLNLDRSGTVCVLGSEDFFPCRGLLKRLRTCNLQFNRPAINPFICGAQCPSGQSARGAYCYCPDGERATSDSCE